jgi:hypothetical protein
MSNEKTQRVNPPTPLAPVLPEFVIVMVRHWKPFLFLLLLSSVVGFVTSYTPSSDWLARKHPMANWEIGGAYGDGGEWPKEWPYIMVHEGPLRVVEPVYYDSPLHGKRIEIVDDDKVPLSHIERHYTVVNTADRVVAIKFTCKIENEVDSIRRPLRSVQRKLVFVSGRDTKRVRIWFTHYSLFTQVYRMSCRWDLAELKDSVLHL